MYLNCWSLSIFAQPPPLRLDFESLNRFWLKFGEAMDEKLFTLNFDFERFISILSVAILVIFKFMFYSLFTRLKEQNFISLPIISLYYVILLSSLNFDDFYYILLLLKLYNKFYGVFVPWFGIVGWDCFRLNFDVYALFGNAYFYVLPSIYYSLFCLKRLWLILLILVSLLKSLAESIKFSYFSEALSF